MNKNLSTCWAIKQVFTRLQKMFSFHRVTVLEMNGKEYFENYHIFGQKIKQRTSK